MGWWLGDARWFGDRNFTIQPMEYRWTKRFGWVRDYTLRGPKIDTALVLRQLPRGMVDVKISEGTASITLVVTYSVADPGAEDPQSPADPLTTAWTLVGNEIQAPIFGAPNVVKLSDWEPSWPARIDARVRAYRAQLDSEVKTTSQRSSQTPVVTIDIYDNSLVPKASNAPSDLQTYANELADELLKNVRSFQFSQYVLRKIQLVTDDSQIRISHQNVGRPYSYGALIQTEPTLPDYQLIKLEDLQAYQWLKKTPTVEQTNQGRFQLTQEYWGAESFSDLIYGAVI